MRIIICFTVGILCAGLAKAGLITEGTIERLGPNHSSIDLWGFSTSGGDVVFDLLSWEIDATTGLTKDVNGDGELAFLDTYIYLLRDDGDLTKDDKIARNDDSVTTLSSDGSIAGYDSFLATSVAAGNYFLAVGAFGLSMDEILVGINQSNFFPDSCAGEIGETCERIRADHGDYRITWTGDISLTENPGVVISAPEPGTLALLSLGLLSVGLSRRVTRETSRTQA